MADVFVLVCTTAAIAPVSPAAERVSLRQGNAIQVSSGVATHERIKRRIRDGLHFLFKYGRFRDFRGIQCVELVGGRSEEHTSELQSRQYLVCRLLLEKKKKKILRNYLVKKKKKKIISII